MGVPLEHTAYLFGDNKSVVDSATLLTGKLHKRHNILSYHKVRPVISEGWLQFICIVGTSSPADVLSKHWGYSCVWHLLCPIMHIQKDATDVVFCDAEGKKMEASHAI